MNRHFYKKIALSLVLSCCFLSSNTLAEQPNNNLQQKNSTSSTKHKFALHNFTFETETPLATVIHNIADFEQINVIFEDTIEKLAETKKVTFSAKNVTAPHALDMVLKANRLGYAVIDKRSIIVFTEALANKQHYEDLMVRVFYLKNTNFEDIKNSILQTLGTRQLVPIKQLNAFVVRDSEENLKLIESLLSRLDKQQSKFVIDVNLYEVNAQLTTQIGDLSGTISSKDLSLLQNNTSSRLIGSTKLHAFENQPVAFTMGKRVPISLTKTKKVSNTPSTSSVEHSKQSEQTSEQNDNTKSSSAYEEQLQYVDIGLNMELSPVIYEDSVQMNTNIELTGATNATPNVELNHHRVREMISIKNDQTKLVTNTFPISSNFFVSTQNNSPANLVITITPHIISSPEITPLDKTPIGSNGTATHFDTSISLEEMVIRADQDEAHSK